MSAPGESWVHAESVSGDRHRNGNGGREGPPLFEIGPGVERAVEGRPYERRPSDPLHRPLRIYTRDPSTPKLDGAVAVVNVPYEPLEAGFRGRVFEVNPRDGGSGEIYESLRLDDPVVLLQSGRSPSPADPLFHQQMVYAVSSLTYAAFKNALGRHLAWGFERKDGGRLRLSPYGALEANAYYDPAEGEISFGYFLASSSPTDRTLPRGWVFTSLSHDVVAHEVTHAMLDGLRAHFTAPTGPDVAAFHEAFADLVAVFQHFAHEQAVAVAIGKSRGRLDHAKLLTDIASQFGHTTGSDQALRTAIDKDVRYKPALECHALGSVLVSAVFDAFRTVFSRKVARYIRLATAGTGQLGRGDLSPDLQAVLAARASALAEQFLTICIRAVDYCPPVDVEFGEFLRAVITADHDLVPDDPWAYREAWIDAFRCRGIHPRDVHFLSEDALVWKPPTRPVPSIDELSFAKLRFDGDPASPAGAEELRRQATVLGRELTRLDRLETFGLARAGHPQLNGDEVSPPRVQSIRSSRRIGPDGQVLFDLVAEVTQRRHVRGGPGEPGFDFLGGSTIIIDPRGEIRYTIAKSVLNTERLDRQRSYLKSDGQRFWMNRGGRLVPTEQPFRLLHEMSSSARG